AQAACDLELLDCYPFGRCGPDHFTVAGASFARCSRVTLCLRSHIECMVPLNPARIARNGPLRSRLLLLLLASDLFVGCKARRNATPYHIHGVSRVCRIAERCSKKRHGIAKARARRPERNSSRAPEKQPGIANREPGAQACGRIVAAQRGLSGRSAEIGRAHV